MNTTRWFAILALATLLAWAPPATAQQVSPRIGYIYPAGGRAGTTFQVAIGGQFLDGVSGAFFSGAGVRATVIEHTRPLSVEQAGLLKDKLQELQKKRMDAAAFNEKHAGARPATRPTWTADDEKMVVEIRKKLSTFIPRNQINPATVETVTLQVTIAADAEPGQRDMRLGTPLGLSNARVFCVNQLPEFSRRLAVVFREPKDGKGPMRPALEPEMNISLPAVVNGQIMPGEVDRFRFKANKGQRLVVAANARGLIPYLPDAVPGWFQATLAIYDSKGKELAYDDDFRFSPDPVLFYEIPRDGEYAIEIKDALFRGREDFVYRITIGEFPFVTSVFPLGGKAGTQTSIDMKGWNLPTNRYIQNKDAKPGIYPLTVRKGEFASNRVPFAIDTLAECLEREPNNTLADAQTVTLPIIVNGRIDQPGDWDIFRIEGRAGEEIVAEVFARRLDSPVDSILRLTDAAGKQLAYNDDHEDKGSGMTTHHADSYIRFTLPTTGAYFLHLGDVQHKGGTEYAYRLRISSPQPDFELRATPASVNVRGGANVPLTVYALRKDGFSGEIALSLKNAPAGYSLSGARIPANQDQVRLTLSAPATASKEPVSINIEGRAMIHGREAVRAAVPAEDMMQAFSYRHLVVTKEMLVGVMGRWMPKTAARILSPTPLKITAGGTARIQTDASTSTFIGAIQFELSEPPEGITLLSVTPTRAGTEIVLQCDAAKAKPGLKGNLIFTAFTEKTPAAGAKNATKRRTALGSLPAIPFEVVAR